MPRPGDELPRKRSSLLGFSGVNLRLSCSQMRSDLLSPYIFRCKPEAGQRLSESFLNFLHEIGNMDAPSSQETLFESLGLGVSAE